jgi:hypothetical protein
MQCYLCAALCSAYLRNAVHVLNTLDLLLTHHCAYILCVYTYGFTHRYLQVHDLHSVLQGWPACRCQTGENLLQLYH